ncbi:MAG: hypothetical protein K0Q77_116 [Anaerosporomusa subterranea]|nr:hypothetical protein [Anaerosporomusa subterranea]
MGEEKSFEREVLDRLITIETTLKSLTVQCPRCQDELIAHGKSIVSLDASTKSAHHRIDGVYKTAGIISATVGLLVSVLSFLFNNIPKGGH